MNALSMKVRIMLCLCIVLSSVLIPFQTALAQNQQIFPGIVNEASTLPPNQIGYQEFRTNTVGLAYSGGTVCISSSSTSCAPLQIDDGIRISVNNTERYYSESRTQQVGPFDLTSFLVKHVTNSIKVVLFDMQGPYRGGSPVYLVVQESNTNQWLNNCIPVAADILPTSDTEVQIKLSDLGINAELYQVFNYSIDGTLCDEFNAKKSGNTYEITGMTNGNSFMVKINDRGVISEIGVDVPLDQTQSQFTRLGDTPSVIVEHGNRFYRIIGTPREWGLDIHQVIEDFWRVKRKQQPSQVYNHAPVFDASQAESAYRWTLVGGAVVLLIGAATVPISVPAASAATLTILASFGLPTSRPPDSTPQMFAQAAQV